MLIIFEDNFLVVLKIGYSLTAILTKDSFSSLIMFNILQPARHGIGDCCSCCFRQRNKGHLQ